MKGLDNQFRAISVIVGKAVANDEEALHGVERELWRARTSFGKVPH
jgi:hypothetical protein